MTPLRVAIMAACLGAVIFAHARPGAAEDQPAAVKPFSLDQNWSPAEREEFWFTSQGSRLIPYDWFMALEAADGTPFRNNSNLAGYGYLPAGASHRNPDALPVGFVRDTDDASGASFLGFTCAACHTNRIRAGTREILVDGAPVLADLGAFRAGLAAAVADTLTDEARFSRLAAALGAQGDAAAELRGKLQEFNEALRDDVARNTPPHPAGPGRLDAFGEIYNAVTAKALGLAENAQPPAAPVSYPAIWDAPQHDCVQWNGAASNAGLGHLVRNTGEVLGVFGTLEFRAQPPSSSARIENLQRLEALLTKLWSPEWPPEALGPVQGDVEQGRSVYAETCEGCHAPLHRDRPDRRIAAKVVHVGTDPAMYDQFFRTVATGPLAGSTLGGAPLAPRVPALTIVSIGVLGVLRGAQAGIPHFDEELGRFLAEREACQRVAGPARYKARPLNGIWATAPYLHNGSVPSLRALLDPPEARPTEFRVGSAVFDPENVGFCATPGCGGYRFDTAIEANSNAGHAFGTDLKPEDKQALIAYLKTL